MRKPGILFIALAVLSWWVTARSILTPRAAPLAAAATQDSLGQWSAVMVWPIIAIHAHLLPTGKVMATDGLSINLWDPATGNLTTPALPGYDIFCSGHSFLFGGQLLVTGGHIENYTGLPNASLYDPFTDSWTRLPDMNAGRWYPTNTTLGNGDVLVLSGDTTPTRRNNLPQVWESQSGTWRDLTNAVASMLLYPRMFLAPDGKVFRAGPEKSTLYLDPAGSGSWTQGPSRNFGNRSYGPAVMYDAGKVLIVGGGDPPTDTAEVIDLNTANPIWRNVSTMQYPRRQHNATLLPDGTVLVTGGSSGSGFSNEASPVLPAEMWDPETESWSTMAAMQIPRLYHSTALLLPDGRVLSAGGGSGGNTTDRFNAEIYSPPYLFKGARPEIASVSSTVDYGEPFFVQTPHAASITKVSLLRLSSVTHAFNQTQQFNPLAFVQVSGGLNVTPPTNDDATPPGHYMLFIVNGSGVPSVAKIVQLLPMAGNDSDGKDLVIENLALSSSGVAAGGSTTASYRVANRGAVKVTETYTDRIYLSTNQTYDAADALLGTSHGHTPDLAFNATHAHSQAVAIPGSTAAGNYFILVRGDALGAVVESNELNNVTAVPLTVTASTSGKDLVIENLAASPVGVSVGGNTTVSYVVANRGSVKVTETYTDKIYLSANQTYETADTLLGTSHGHTSDLALNATHSASYPVTIPAGTAPGNYFILVRTDALAKVTEVNESNNVTAVTVTVTASTTGKDLVIENLAASPVGVSAGGSITLSYRVANRAAVTVTETYTDRFYLS
ncbi:MAG: galactose oxidase-like domain-containing protein, partial [Candidatus Binatia bacterium]